MSIRTDIRDLIDPLLDGGCHSVVNRDATIVQPYAVLHKIAGTPTPGISGEVLAQRDLYQIDVLAASPEQAEGLSLGTIKTALEGYGATMVSENDGEYNPVDKTFQFSTGYHIWE